MPLTGAGILVSALMLIFTNQADEEITSSGDRGIAKTNTISITSEEIDEQKDESTLDKVDIKEEKTKKNESDNKIETIIFKNSDNENITIARGHVIRNKESDISNNNDQSFKYKNRKVRKLKSVNENGKSNLSTSISLGRSGKDNSSMLLHPSANNKRTGHSIGGIVVLNLDREELEKIGVKINSNTIEFVTERTDRIHPIDYKRMEEYRNSEDVQKYLASNYPTDGSLFCIKEHIAVEIKDWEIRDRREAIDEEMKNLGYQGYDSRWSEEKKKRANEMNKEMNRLYQLKANVALNKELLEYDGKGIDGYSGISPLLYTCTYKDKKDNILNRVFKTPLFFIQNPRHPLFLTNSDPYYKDMVPVEINLNEYFDNHDDYYAERVVLWYYPTDEFLNALPDRYAEKLRREAEILRQIRSGALPEEEACKGFTEDESFYDICRISSGPVSIQNVFPNPALNSTSLKFRVNKQARVAINLYRTNGDFVREVRGEQLLTQGDYSININVSSLQPGIYLASVKTNKGEVAVIRFVKQ